MATLWLFLSLERGVLSGLHAYKPVGLSIVGEAVVRLGSALVLIALGAGVTGAFLGLPIGWLVMSAALAVSLRRRIGVAGGRAAAHAHRPDHGPPGRRWSR